MTIAWSSRIRRGLFTLAVILPVVFGADAYFTRQELNAAIAENASLQKQLTDGAGETLACRKDNINLILWKARATVMMFKAAAFLDACNNMPKNRRLSSPLLEDQQ